MRVRGIGLGTELALAATRGRITDRGDYIVVEMPDDPGYYYGNLLVWPAPPQVGEVAYWTRRFHDELGANPAIKHVAFGWDSVSGDAGATDELAAAGFTVESRMRVMSADAVVALPPALPVRALEPDELAATAELAYAIGDRHDEPYREFLQRRAAWHAHLVARGLARFHGAFDGRVLVASLGLVAAGPVARFQDVQTAPTYRKRGLAHALLGAAAAGAVPAAAQRPLVILALAGSDAERVYARAGFRVIERTASACRYPADSTPPDRP